MPSPPRVRHLGCTKAFLRNLFFGPSQGPQFPALDLERNILQRIDPVRLRLRRRDESRGLRKKIFYHGYHNRAPGKARDGATEGRPEGRDERDRASQISRIQNPKQFAPRKRGSHSRREWKRVFRSPSASLLASGLPKTPPNQHADSRPQLPRCSRCPRWLIFCYLSRLKQAWSDHSPPRY